MFFFQRRKDRTFENQEAVCYNWFLGRALSILKDVRGRRVYVEAPHIITWVYCFGLSLQSMRRKANESIPGRFAPASVQNEQANPICLSVPIVVSLKESF